MKTKILLIVCLGSALFFSSCYHEDELTPSHFDRDWYAIEDADNPLDHMRYTVYKESGISIFYNDTIGSVERGEDAFGNPVIYYEVLHPDYTILSMVRQTTYELSDSPEDLMLGVKFVQERVIPELISPLLYPRCFLLVKELTLGSLASYSADCYLGMMTTLISHVEKLKDMDEEAQRRLAMQVVGEQVGAYLVDSCSAWLEPFYNVARKEVNANGSMYSFMLTPASTPKFAPVEEYGFLSFDRTQLNNAMRCTTVAERRDVMDFATEVYMNDDTAFQEKYRTYPYVLKKYELMKKIIANMKQQLTQ